MTLVIDPQNILAIVKLKKVSTADLGVAFDPIETGTEVKISLSTPQGEVYRECEGVTKLELRGTEWKEVFGCSFSDPMNLVSQQELGHLKYSLKKMVNTFFKQKKSRSDPKNERIRY